MSLHDDESDPTGMRELLRGLPDPGPMPDDLVARIRSSLAELPAAHAVPAADAAAPAVSRGTRTGTDSDRPSWWARTGPRLAVAAAVLLGGGAVASGQLGLLATSSDNASTSADSSVGGRADEGAAGSDSGSTTPESLQTAPVMRQTVPGPVVVTMSGRRYTTASFAAQVSSTTGSTPTGPLAAESPGIGPIGTEIGVRSCLVALGLPEETGARVDLAPFDDEPAAVVVVTHGGGRTAYAVGRDCSIGNPSLLAGPVELP
ncbi:hypothetical protein N798_03995 [Knoellia flava TL1]|uniref:Uncharacterized protein n=2 Tax=Knoellia flava TaxID=913969 RepID=A0A8H9FXQ5_9MICO|nr:hypothetical protein [Knoellia flava]KGN35260.1 hypothetical protein N798_03995 [Knoellia flava TL1]GGB90376.1 hypothetical protein GCM10011314_32800 [Knoellia flava]